MDLMHRLRLCIALLLGFSSLCMPSPIGEFEVEFISEPKCSSTPLHSAVFNGTSEEVSALIREGADMYALDCQGLSPMHIAIQEGKSEMILALLDNDFDLNFQFKNDETVLFFATRKGNLQIIEQLIQYGSNVNVVSKQGSSPLLEAKIYNTNDVIDLLTRYGASLTMKLSNGDTLLHRAAESGNIRNVIALVDKFNLSIDGDNYDGETPLFKAVTHNRPAIINILASRGAKLEKTINGKSYLFLAVQSKSLNSLVCLLDHNIPVESDKDDVHLSPLFEAVRLNLKEAAEILTKDGANIKQVWPGDDKNEIGLNLLHFATEYGYDKAIEWLVDLGINVNSRTRAKLYTPLHLAAIHDQLDTANALIHKGASVACQDYVGGTPDAYAKSTKMWDLLNNVKATNCDQNE